MPDHPREPVPDENREAELFEERRGLERWVLPYLEDSSLWPILIVIVFHVVAFFAPVLLWAGRDRSPPAILLVLLGAYGTFRLVRWEKREREKLGVFTGLAAALWLLCLAGAIGAQQAGIL